MLRPFRTAAVERQALGSLRTLGINLTVMPDRPCEAQDAHAERWWYTHEMAPLSRSLGEAMAIRAALACRLRGPGRILVVMSSPQRVPWAIERQLDTLLEAAGCSDAVICAVTPHAAYIRRGPGDHHTIVTFNDTPPVERRMALTWTAAQRWIVRALTLSDLGEPWWPAACANPSERRDEGWTARDLARVSGMHIATVARTLSGLVARGWATTAKPGPFATPAGRVYRPADRMDLVQAYMAAARSAADYRLRYIPTYGGPTDTTGDAIWAWASEAAATMGPAATRMRRSGWDALTVHGLAISAERVRRPTLAMGRNHHDLTGRLHVMPADDASAVVLVSTDGDADIGPGDLTIDDPLGAWWHVARDPHGSQQADELLGHIRVAADRRSRS
jgi:hypothetical protein